jgi:hypothetical protein
MEAQCDAPSGRRSGRWSAAAAGAAARPGGGRSKSTRRLPSQTCRLRSTKRFESSPAAALAPQAGLRLHYFRGSSHHHHHHVCGGPTSKCRGCPCAPMGQLRASKGSCDSQKTAAAKCKDISWRFDRRHAGIVLPAKAGAPEPRTQRAVVPNGGRRATSRGPSTRARSGSLMISAAGGRGSGAGRPQRPSQERLRARKGASRTPLERALRRMR